MNHQNTAESHWASPEGRALIDAENMLLQARASGEARSVAGALHHYCGAVGIEASPGTFAAAVAALVAGCAAIDFGELDECLLSEFAVQRGATVQ